MWDFVALMLIPIWTCSVANQPIETMKKPICQSQATKHVQVETQTEFGTPHLIIESLEHDRQTTK